MVPRKGVDNVISALSVLKESGYRCRLVIVGGEGDNNTELLRLKEIAKAKGVEDRVTFTGRKNREELKYYYSCADIFITTPWYEPLWNYSA